MDVLTEPPLMRPPATETPKQLHDRLKTTLGALEDAIVRGDRLQQALELIACNEADDELAREVLADHAVVR